MRSTLKDFLDNEKTGGLILICCTAVSLLLANTIPAYGGIWHIHLLDMSLVHWINDGLMSIFFLLVGLELKREFLAGELSSVKKALTPAVAALGGVLVPAFLYFLLNMQTGNMDGIGIPMATDIAFALTVVSLLGNRVPLSVKVFLTALAVIDDLVAILIIAIFYTKTIDPLYLAISLATAMALSLMNRLQVRGLAVYILGGLVMWYFMLRSGVHASISGVLLAMVVPFAISADKSPAQHLQHALHKPVTFLVLPLFALANTSIDISLSTFADLGTPVSLGIGAGLLIGKPLGIVSATFLAVRARLGELPLGLKWRHIVGIGMVSGIGFTMSIFMTVLAFSDDALVAQGKFSVLLASSLSGVLGYIVLNSIFRKESG